MIEDFILEENIKRYQLILKTSIDEEHRSTVCRLLIAAQRDLALLRAKTSGAFPQHWPGTSKTKFAAADRQPSRFIKHLLDDSQRAYLILDPRPGLHIVDANAAHSRATMTAAPTLFGKKLFEAFPDNPDQPDANGVSRLFDSLAAVASQRKTHMMAIQRYDIRAPDGSFQMRYWQPINAPVFDQNGELIYITHHIEDVTKSYLG